MRKIIYNLVDQSPWPFMVSGAILNMIRLVVYYLHNGYTISWSSFGQSYWWYNYGYLVAILFTLLGITFLLEDIFDIYMFIIGFVNGGSGGNQVPFRDFFKRFTPGCKLKITGISERLLYFTLYNPEGVLLCRSSGSRVHMIHILKDYPYAEAFKEEFLRAIREYCSK